MKVRIKMKTKPGDQVDYALSTGPMYGHINDYAYSDRDPDIKDALHSVKRSEANIEAEGGETALGDFNEDGMLEHSKIRGKRHHEGGVPLNVPDGTFLFSDTRKLKIKDKAALDYFGSKKPATPAALAKKYDLNKYNAILKDPRASRLEKETADRMIKNHLTKLSELALLQESMKGMPNGVPSFVESVMGGGEQAQYGGFITSDKNTYMQTGGEKTVYPRDDIRSYGSFGRGLYNVGEFFGDVFDAIGNRIDSSLSARDAEFKYKQELARMINKGAYNLFLNPSVSNKNTSVNPVVNVKSNTSRTENKSDSSNAVKKVKSIDDIKFQDGGEATYEVIETEDLGKVFLYTYPDGRKQLVDSKGKILKESSSASKSNTNNNNPVKEVPAQDQYYRYNPLFKDIIEQQDAAGNVIHSRQNLTQPFGVQPARGGVYGFQDYDWDDFVQRHGDWIETEYGDYGGIEGFLKDVQDPAKSKQATIWFQSTINKFSREEFGRDYFAPSSTSPYGVDGEFGAVTFSVPRFFKINQNDPNYKPEVDSPAIPAAEVAKEAPKEEKINEALPFTGTLRPRDSRWYIQDSLNLAGALTDRVDVFEPTKQQVDFQAPDATYLDPSRQIAAAQEQDARYQDVAMNTAEGQVARANILGSSGQTAGQIADILANYENQNVQIANQNAAQRADVENREILMNTELDAKYNQEKAIVGQATRNALRELKNRRLLALNTGITNNQKKRMFEQVMFPQVSVDSVTGDWYTTNGRNLQDTVETYTNPALGGTSSMNPLKQVAQIGSQMVQLKKQLINEGMSEEDAKWVMSQSSRSLRPNFETSDQLYRNQLFNYASPF